MEHTEEEIKAAYRLWMIDYMVQAESVQDGLTYPKPPYNMFKKNQPLVQLYLSKLQDEDS